MNEANPRDKATLEHQETVEQIVHMGSTNAGTMLVGSEHKEIKQKRANFSRGYDYLFPRIDPDPDPQIDAMSSSETKLNDLDRSGILYQR